jgi:deferrochelatase/peroxidase EfeB
LASLKPPVLEPLPALAGEALEQSSSGGDICVQACAEDQQVNFHAIHVLAMLARDDAQLRWSQLGFRTQPANGGTGRNLIGFKDGTRNLDPLDRQAMDRFVWVGTSTTRSTSARGMPQAGR